MRCIYEKRHFQISTKYPADNCRLGNIFGRHGLFLSPNRLAPGGVTGIAVIINGVTGFPTGITAFILNIPLLTIAVIVFGYRFFSTTVIATALSSLLIDQFAAFAPATDDLLLYAFAGGH